MKEFAIPNVHQTLHREGSFSQVTNPDLVGAKRRGLLIEAHPDDSALAEGALELLTSRGVGMTIATLTDGGARSIRGMRPEHLVQRRKIEGVRGAVTSHAARLLHAALPYDGTLSEHEEECIAVVEGIIAVHNPEFVVVTNTQDMHGDHASAGKIAQKATHGKVPVYEMDTITFGGIHGSELPLTHVLHIPPHIKKQRDESYRSHTSQTRELPPHEALEVERVIQMPSHRGRERGVFEAAVLHQVQGDGDPIGELLEPFLLFNREENVA